MRYVTSERVTLRQLAMPLEETSESARPYRCGMVLLCMGALINWLGFAQNYEHPVRYIGIACIIAGALLIASAICCWAKSTPHQRTENEEAQNQDGIHVIQIEGNENLSSKPPDYESLTEAPPSYDEAIKLDPAQLYTVTVSKPSIS